MLMSCSYVVGIDLLSPLKVFQIVKDGITVGRQRVAEKHDKLHQLIIIKIHTPWEMLAKCDELLYQV